MENLPHELNLEQESLEAVNYYEHAEKGTRFLNYIIDLVMTYLVSALAGVAIAFVVLTINPESLLFDEVDTLGENLIFRLIGLICFVLYYTFFEYYNNGKTIGKIITKTHVRHEKGIPLTFKTILNRSLSRIVPFEPFSFLGERGWHDSWTNTMVVKDRK